MKEDKIQAEKRAQEEIFFLINPYAAQGKAGKWWKNITPLLDNAAINYQYAYTRGSSIGSQVEEAIGQGARIIFAIGGDGTVNEILNGVISNDQLKEDDIIFGFWPGGTANDFGRMIYDDLSSDAFIELLKNWKVKQVDIGKISFTGFSAHPEVRYFLNEFSMGLGADTCYIVNNNTKAWGGRITFFAAALRAILEFKPMPISLDIDGEKVEDSYVLISLTNGCFFGGGMMIAPHAVIDDGYLDLVMAAGLKKSSIIKLLTKVYKGKHLEHQTVINKKVKKVHIESINRLLLEVDGETPGYTPVDVEILPYALPLIVPGKR